VKIERSEGRPLVVGHRGASAVAPENSLAALAAAVDAGAQLVEFDISPGLVVAHDSGSAGPSLDEALDLLGELDVGLHLDLKQAGYEQAVLEAVDRRGLRPRVLVSTALYPVARRVRALAPDLPVAIGYPHDRHGVSRFQWPASLTRAGAAALRAAMPARIPLLLRQTQANVLSLHHTLCSEAAVAVAHRAGVPVLVWTVNDPSEARRFAAFGVEGIVTDDPKTVLATLLGP